MNAARKKPRTARAARITPTVEQIDAASAALLICGTSMLPVNRLGMIGPVRVCRGWWLFLRPGTGYYLQTTTAPLDANYYFHHASYREGEWIKHGKPPYLPQFNAKMAPWARV